MRLSPARSFAFSVAMLRRYSSSAGWSFRYCSFFPFWTR